MWPDRDRFRSGTKPRRLHGHTDDILSVAFCPPNLICTGAYNGVLLVHNCESGAIQKRIQITRPTHTDTAPTKQSGGGGFSLLERSLMELGRRDGGSRGTARGGGEAGLEGSSGDLNEARTAAEPSLFNSIAIEALAVIDSGRRLRPDAVLLCGSADGYLRLWSARDFESLICVRGCRGETEGVQSVCSEPSSTIVVSGDSAGRIKVWHISEMAS